MVDELGPDRFTAFSGSIVRTSAGVGGSAIDSVASQKRLDGAAVPRDPLSTRNGGLCRGESFATSGEGSGVFESGQGYILSQIIIAIGDPQATSRTRATKVEFEVFYDEVGYSTQAKAQVRAESRRGVWRQPQVYCRAGGGKRLL